MKKPEGENKIGWREKLLNSPAGQEYLAERDRGEPLQKWQREAIAAKTVSEHRQALTDSIIALRLMAEYRGDKEAVIALVECGVQAAHQLHTLHQGHDADDKPPADSLAVMLVNEVAASAEHWPVAISAFYEKRKPHLKKTLPQGIGSKLPFRAASSSRKMGNDTPTDFALWVFERIERFRNRHDTFQPLSSSWITGGIVFTGPPRTYGDDVWGEDADMLEPFSEASLASWVVVAMELLEHECAGHWNNSELAGRLFFRDESENWWGYLWPNQIQIMALRFAKEDAMKCGHRDRTTASTLGKCTKRAVEHTMEERGKSLIVSR
jgi:hypothetical protein